MEQITVDDLLERLKNGKLRVLDVREPEEYEAANIGAVSLPLSKLKSYETDVIDDWDQEEEIVIHCKSGKRSLEACLILQSMGFKRPVNLVGGIEAWMEKLGGRKLR